MCNFCAKHKEDARSASISAVENLNVHTGTAQPYDAGRWDKFKPKVKKSLIKPEDVPVDLTFLRAGLAAAQDGTLTGGDE